MDSVEFLDAVRVRHGLSSDNKLAVFLNINRGRVSLYRTRARKLDPKACHKVAAALEVTPDFVMASVQAERATCKKDRIVWTRLARLAKKAQAAALLVGITALLSASPDALGQTKGSSDAAALDHLYIIRSRRRGKGHWRNTVVRPLRRLFAAWRTVFRPIGGYGSSRAWSGAQAAQSMSGWSL
ncbi:hypothetical protein LCGC14_0639790 [marine sediment metagenome]|uniref:Uncharacterized protein n=1 Tax=marine sediment metagenome TaxID=412755 RepID=A0A0F9R4Q5_9ZZZZ